MKIALLNDTHVGVRNSAEVFINFQKRFYEEIFFPYCKNNNIKQIIHLGDYYDHRKFVNFKALRENRRHFLEPMKQAGMTMDIIPGNHDVFHKNTNDLCSLKELLGYYTSNINIIMKPSTLSYDGLDIHLLPWINPENYDHSMKFVKKNYGILFAHLELQGFEMMRGIKQPKGSGMGVEPFSHYDLVLSGHYHASSQQGNIRYLGSQMEFTWADAGDQKYFHIFDTDTQEVERIGNPLTLFEKIHYDDTDTDYTNYDINILTNKFVKVIVGNKSNPFMFDKFIERISELKTHDLKIAENFSEFLGENVLTNVEDIENTTDLMASYIDGVNTELDKEKLKTLMNSLYNDALDMEIQ